MLKAPVVFFKEINHRDQDWGWIRDGTDWLEKLCGDTRSYDYFPSWFVRFSHEYRMCALAELYITSLSFLRRKENRRGQYWGQDNGRGMVCQESWLINFGVFAECSQICIVTLAGQELLDFGCEYQFSGNMAKTWGTQSLILCSEPLVQSFCRTM